MAPKKPKKALTFTDACQKLLLDLEKDLKLSLEDDESTAKNLRDEWQAAKNQERTAQSFKVWRDDVITQVGASWILSCVFVRFVEDNDLIERPLISGRTHEDASQSRLQQAKDSERAYYQAHPDHAEREYLLHVFEEVSALPGMADLFDQSHAMLWRIMPRIEGGRLLLGFFRTLDDETGQIRWDLTDADRNTRFLGDLYQDLSVSARKKYALLQTPDFIEEFILDRTLEPAIETFGLATVRMIDPTCGSGHFLLGGFDRLLGHWQREEPGTDVRELVRRSLDGVWGVDLNPFAVAIAYFRLTVAALKACDVRRLADAPDFPMHLAAGDSLLHRPRQRSRGYQQKLADEDSIGHLYRHEEGGRLRQILGQEYHAVVGNPPYITPKEKALNAAYRELYGSCSGKYALSVPFMERFVELAMSGEEGRDAGYVGKITSNSFMKREFGKKLIEEYFLRWDLTHVVDTSGAYIPGHGTPTVILFLRNQGRVSNTIRAVLGIRGEPSTPSHPEAGLVWRSISDLIDQPGAEDDFVSVEDRPCSSFDKHPWSLGGGGASDLLKQLDGTGASQLQSAVESVGITCFTLEDDVFVRHRYALERIGLQGRLTPMVVGDDIRDWAWGEGVCAIFPYDRHDFLYDRPRSKDRVLWALWPWRTVLRGSKLFGGLVKEEGGVGVYEYGRLTTSKLKLPLSIVFAFVATHNHFVLDRGGKVFKQSAPVIKLPPGATEEDHLSLLAVLNSSSACFWMQQVFHNKGGPGGGSSKDEKWKDFYEHDGTKLAKLPIPQYLPGALSRRCDELARRLNALSPGESLRAGLSSDGLNANKAKAESVFRELVWCQEELDWRVLCAYGLVDDSVVLPDRAEPVEILPGERSFEIRAARQEQAGELSTRWFEWTGARRVDSIPNRWPRWYRDLVDRRLMILGSNRHIRLIESMACKRRWEREAWDDQLARALDDTLLQYLEGLERWEAKGASPATTARLAEVLEADERFMALLQLRAKGDVVDVQRVVEELVSEEAVPFLPSMYLKPDALEKRAEWEQTWRLQRLEDPFLDRQQALLDEHFGATPEDQRRARAHVACWKTSDKVTKEGDVTDDELEQLAALRLAWREIDEERKQVVGGETPPVPPKYKSADFQRSSYWRLRGKLDVPKERFISYPYCSPEGDPTLRVGWAGWDHEQRAAALATVLQERCNEGWNGERLAPIFQGLLELVPWLKQWHGDLGDEYELFVEAEAAKAGLALEDVRAWRPPEVKRGRRRKAAKKT